MYSLSHSPHQINTSTRARFALIRRIILNPCLRYFSGGADDTVLKYDLTRYNTSKLEGDGPAQTYTQHTVSAVLVVYY